jgi:carboxyl-terminal processing protease
MSSKVGWSVLLCLVAACSSPPVVTALPPTPATTAVPVTTTVPDIELTVTGCSSPPVTFGLLCEVVQLLAVNHFSPPDDGRLAEAALTGIEQFETRDTAETPRGLTCAIPSETFASLCSEVVERLETDPVPVADLVEAGVINMLAGTVDPYTMYVPPELAGAVGEDGIVPGVGVVVAAQTAAGSPCVRIEGPCPLRVLTVLGGSPAEEAGLLMDDVIVAVDGTLVQGLTVIEVAAGLAGEAGTTAVLDVVRDGESLQINVTRADASALPVTSEMVGQLGYLRLPEFGFDAHLFFHFALQNLIDSGARRLILDLRDNPGGFLFSVSIIGSEFFSSGLLYKTMSPAEDLDYPAVDGGIATRIPVIVLVNGSSASAAEILAAVLQERGRAVIVGTPTYGKNLVQVPFSLRNGGALRVSISRWTTPAGASVESTGVVPDVTADIGPELTIEEVVAAALAAVG